MTAFCVHHSVQVSGAFILPIGSGGAKQGAVGVPEPFADPSGAWARRLDPLSVAAIQAVAGARQMAKLPSSDLGPNAREGICVGTAYGSQQTRLRYASRLLSHGLANTNPIDFPDSVDGAPAAHVALTWHLMGPSLTFLSGVESARRALISAAQQLLLGTADRMHVVVGDVYDARLTGSQKISTCGNAVVAVVLERSPSESARASSMEGGAIELAGVPHPTDTACEIVDIDVDAEASDVGGDAQLDDTSGVSQLIDAWCGACAPLNGMGASCHAECKCRGLRAFPISAAGGQLLAFLKWG